MIRNAWKDDHDKIELMIIKRSKRWSRKAHRLSTEIMRSINLIEQIQVKAWSPISILHLIALILYDFGSKYRVDNHNCHCGLKLISLKAWSKAKVVDWIAFRFQLLIRTEHQKQLPSLFHRTFTVKSPCIYMLPKNESSWSSIRNWSVAIAC